MPTQGFQVSSRVGSNYQPVAPRPLQVVDGRTLAGEFDSTAMARGAQAGAQMASGLLSGIKSFTDDLKEENDPVLKAQRAKTLAEVAWWNENKDLLQGNALSAAQAEGAKNQAIIEALSYGNPYALDTEGKQLDLQGKRTAAESAAKTQPLKDELIINTLTAQLGRLPTENELAIAKSESDKKDLDFNESIRSDKESLTKEEIGAKKGALSEIGSPVGSQDISSNDGLPPMPRKTIFNPFSGNLEKNPDYTSWLALKKEKWGIDYKAEMEGKKPIKPSAEIQSEIQKEANGLASMMEAIDQLKDIETGPVDRAMARSTEAGKQNENIGFFSALMNQGMQSVTPEDAIKRDRLISGMNASIVFAKGGKALTKLEQSLVSPISPLDSAEAVNQKMAANIPLMIKGFESNLNAYPGRFEEYRKTLDALKEFQKTYFPTSITKSSGLNMDSVPLINTRAEADKLDPKIEWFKTPEGKVIRNPNFKKLPGITEG